MYAVDVIIFPSKTNIVIIVITVPGRGDIYRANENVFVFTKSSCSPCVDRQVGGIGITYMIKRVACFFFSLSFKKRSIGPDGN